MQKHNQNILEFFLEATLISYQYHNNLLQNLWTKIYIFSVEKKEKRKIEDNETSTIHMQVKMVELY